MNRSTLSTLSASAERHLGSYALAATASIGALTGAQVAHAGVMSFTYSNEVLSPAYNSTQTFLLFPGGPTLSETEVDPGSSNIHLAGAVAGQGLALQGGGYATNLTAGTAISAAQSFTAVGASSMGHNRAIGYNNSYVRTAGNFIGAPGYVGFKFTDPNTAQTDYGWVRIGETDSYGSLDTTIYSAAYNTGGPIIAGEAVVPEPGSLALLAGGAGCLAAWRLRRAGRKQAAAPADDAGSVLAS